MHWTPLFTLSRQIAPLFRRPTPIGESAAALQIECCPLDGGVEVFCELRDCVRPVSLIHCRVCKCVREMCVALTVLNCSPRVQYVRVAKALATYASASHMECKRRKTSHGLGFPFPPLSEKPPLSRRCQPRVLLSGSHIPRTCATWVLRCAFALGECACIVALHPHSRTSRCDPTPLTVCVALGAKPLVWPSPRAGEHFTVSLAVKVCAPALHPY